MPRYYCDYCDTYLTHDSPSVRKQHNAGYKHKANVRNYYQQFEEQQTQSLIDQKVKEHLGAYLVRPQYPSLPTALLPVPGAPPQMTAYRPPVLPRPVPVAPGYGTAPMMAPYVGLPGAPMSTHSTGLPRPPTINFPTAATGGVPVPGSNATPQTIYQANPTAPGSTAPLATSSIDSFGYAQASEVGD